MSSVRGATLSSPPTYKKTIQEHRTRNEFVSGALETADPFTWTAGLETVQATPGGDLFHRLEMELVFSFHEPQVVGLCHGTRKTFGLPNAEAAADRDVGER